VNNFKLFISSKNPESLRMIDRFDSVLKSICNDQYSLSVIDVLDDPHLATMADVFSTPTLVRLEPLPVKRITGDIRGHENTYKILLKSK